MNKIYSRKILLLLPLLLLCAAITLIAANPADTPGPKATLDDCATCHEAQAKAFANTRHGILDSKGLASKAKADFSCVSCHGDAGKHIEQGGGKGTIMAFAEKETATAKSKACLTCHKDSHPGFFASNHAKAGMACTSCHGIHDQGAKEDAAACASCHADVAAKFKLNERHRLKEGILECTSCHNPHEAASRERLGGFKREACFKCHTDKQGPFVFEHGGNIEESCTACHDPHGSPNRHMLTYQNSPDLCYSCHGNPPSFHSRFTKDTRCTNCHSTIHGSNLSNVFLK